MGTRLGVTLANATPAEPSAPSQPRKRDRHSHPDD